MLYYWPNQLKLFANRVIFIQNGAPSEYPQATVLVSTAHNFKGQKNAINYNI